METLFRRLMQGTNPPPDNRKFSAYFLVLHIIKVQFALNNFKSCERFFKWFENNRREGIELEMFPKAWRVNISYYKGRYHMYSSDFEMAKLELEKAFQLCSQDYIKNKQRILRYLIPIQMNTGNFPSNKLLETYDLVEYKNLVEACLNGDMEILERSIETHMD